MLIDFAAMSNRCWRLANEFTNFTAVIEYNGCDRGHNFTRNFYTNTLRILKEILFSFIRVLHNVFRQPMLTSSFVCSFTGPFSSVLCVPRQRPYREHLQYTDGDITWLHARGLQLSSFLITLVYHTMIPDNLFRCEINITTYRTKLYSHAATV